MLVNNMKQRITLSIDEETRIFLKEEAKRRNISVKKLGEEYFYLMMAEGQAKRLRKTL